MATIAVAKIGATLKINGVEYPIYEGDIVNNLVYMDNGVEKTITGAIRVISASTEIGRASWRERVWLKV